MVLLVLNGMVEIWEEGSGQDSSVAGALADIAHYTFTVVLCAFIVSFWAWFVRRLSSRSG